MTIIRYEKARSKSSIHHQINQNQCNDQIGLSLSKQMKYEQQQSGGSYGGSQVLAWLRRIYDRHWELGNCRFDCFLLIDIGIVLV